MFSFPRKRLSQSSHLGSHPYDPAGFVSHEDDHEMLENDTSTVVEPTATSDHSDTAPMLEPTDSRDTDLALIRFDTAPLLELSEVTDVASMVSGTEPLLKSTKCKDSEEKPHNQIFVEGKKVPRKEKYLHGWRMGITICAVTAGTVFLINLILTIWAISKYGLQKEGFGTIQEGNCKETAHVSFWLHLIINLLSTLLLGASNYSMQCLASPTREEVDEAHHQSTWLDIGVPSVRNLTRIARPRIVLWWLLVISGVPLHLFYNSAIFSTLSAQEYSVYVASPDLVSGNAVDWSAPAYSAYDENNGTLTVGNFRDIGNKSIWQQLDNAACIRAYAEPFVSMRGDLVAISAAVNASILLTVGIRGGSYNYPYNWMCYKHLSEMDASSNNGTPRCDADAILKDPPNWTLTAYYEVPHNEGSFMIEYCLSRLVEERCQIRFSVVILGIVMACNFLKALCMLLALRRQKSRPLVTLGDAVEDFLVKPDRTTRLACLSGKNSFSGGRWRVTSSKWEKKGQRWFLSLSVQRWFVCNSLCILALVMTSVLLQMGLDAGTLTDRHFAHLWQMGYGTVTSESMVSWDLSGPGGLIINVLVANLPQVVVSFLFLTYNGVFTCMLLANEWNGYAHKRKPLRVTNPDGAQVSTYRLQLPYKYGIPLLIISATLHLLLSQSLFLANVDYYTDEREKDTTNSISTIGYSCIAIITFIFFGGILILLGLLNGFRWHEGMPLAGSCSAAISAACHRPEEDIDAAVKPVMWGVVSSKNGFCHCCFTSFEVSPPVQGERYV